MPTIEHVNAQIAKLEHTYIFWTQKEIRYLPQVLAENEKILAITSGLMSGSTWLAICTNRRAIFLDRGMFFGGRQSQMALDRIQSIDHTTGLIFGAMRIWDGASAMSLPFILKNSLHHFVKVTRAAMDAARETRGGSGSGGTDIASQLEKLVALKERGHLTQEEFDTQKKKLLGI